MILAVSGWRDWSDAGFVRRHLTILEDRGVVGRRVGDARGVDQITREYWDEFGLPYTRYNAHWAALGKAAGPRRNWDMLTGVHDLDVQATMLMAFPEPGKMRDEESGTWRCVKQAVLLDGVGVWIPPYTK